MISADFVRTMAAYNRWQNRNLYSAANGLGDDARKAPRGAFFGSIHATLNHLLWGDQVWMSRLAGAPPPRVEAIADSVALYEDWTDLAAERDRLDLRMVEWAKTLDPVFLHRELTYFSGAAGREVTKPNWLLVTHMFNHQTHHRGQVHAMLTAAGARPGATDLPFLPASP